VSNTAPFGGGILNNGMLTVANSMIADNIANTTFVGGGYDDGGGIYNILRYKGS
jgi:hypothetical protein